MSEQAMNRLREFNRNCLEFRSSHNQPNLMVKTTREKLTRDDDLKTKIAQMRLEKYFQLIVELHCIFLSLFSLLCFLHLERLKDQRMRRRDAQKRSFLGANVQKKS